MEKHGRIFKIASLIYVVIFSCIVMSVCESNDTITITAVTANVSDTTTVNETTTIKIEKTITNPRIVIVGAGASGIAAAAKLLEHGFEEVTILEAGDRIGGRVYTTQLGEYSVDLGGQWVHGEEGNVVFELANPLGLLDKSEKSHYGVVQEYFDSLGNIFNDELAKNISNFYFKYVLEFELDNNTAFESLGEYVEKMFDEQFKNVPHILNEKAKYLHHLELFTISLDSADSWKDISTLGEEQYRECLGDQIINWKNRGYSTILDILMKRYPNPEKELPVMKNTILNSEVISIDYLNDVEGPPVLITTSKGQLYKADHVIVTVSLGVLKQKHKSLFIPPLPEYKVETIEGLGYGNVAKIYLLFDKPFWNLGDKRVLHFTFVWNEDEKIRVENDTEKMWTLGMSGAMTVEHKPNLLELWVVGKYAKAMELLPEDKVFNHSIEILHQFLDKKYTVTEPTAILRTGWFSNPYFNGTYSYRSVDSEKRKVYAEMLEKPLIPENLKILFAGEATSMDRFSTVDGAAASGWKAANRLIDRYNKTATT